MICDSMNAGKDDEKDKITVDKIDDNKFVDYVIFQYKHKMLNHFIGKFKIDNYKMKDVKKQSIWSSDVERLTYIIRKAIVEGKRKTNKWEVDKGGVDTLRYIIDPLMNNIKKKLEKFLLIEPVEDPEEDVDLAKHRLEIRKNGGKLLQEIKEGVMQRNILKTIASEFYLKK